MRDCDRDVFIQSLGFYQYRCKAIFSNLGQVKPSGLLLGTLREKQYIQELESLTKQNKDVASLW